MKAAPSQLEDRPVKETLKLSAIAALLWTLKMNFSDVCIYREQRQHRLQVDLTRGQLSVYPSVARSAGQVASRDHSEIMGE